MKKKISFIILLLKVGFFFSIKKYFLALFKFACIGFLMFF